ncbi:MAG: hypothetical protein ACW99A_10445 [Candidatus Kariarchaeaceae archaeon]|jgi:hypothetical protein
MKFHSLSTILLVLSLFFLVPLAEQPETIDILPQTNLSIIKNIRLKQVILTSNHEEEINLIVLSINPIQNKTEVEEDIQFFGKFVVNIPKPGFYQFDFLSPQLTELKFSEEGLYPSYYAIVFVFLTIRVIFILRDRYYTSLDDLI